MSFLSNLFGPPDVNQLNAKGDVKVLMNALDYKKDRFIRINAARALGEKKDPKAVEPLIAALQDSDEDVRSKSAWALGKIGDARAVDPLISRLTDYSYNVRVSAIYALGEIGDAKAVDPLISRLNDSTDKVIASVLGRFKDPRAVQPLIKRLADPHSDFKDPDWDFTTSAAWALGKIGDTRAVKPLFILKGHDWKKVRDAATDALKNFDLSKCKFDCSICTYDIESLTPEYTAAIETYKVTDPTKAAKMAGDLASPDWEEVWKGTICLKCKYTYCENCIKIGPGKCHNCGSELYVLNESSLQGSPYTKRFMKGKTIQRVNG